MSFNSHAGDLHGHLEDLLLVFYKVSKILMPDSLHVNVPVTDFCSTLERFSFSGDAVRLQR